MPPRSAKKVLNKHGSSPQKQRKTPTTQAVSPATAVKEKPEDKKAPVTEASPEGSPDAAAEDSRAVDEHVGGCLEPAVAETGGSVAQADDEMKNTVEDAPDAATGGFSDADEIDDVEVLGEGEANAAGEEAVSGNNEYPEECEPNLSGDVRESGDNNVDKADDNESEEENEDGNHFDKPLLLNTSEKRFEIFVGGLHKNADEDDLTKVFSPFGDIQSIRFATNPFNQKKKGFAFVRYVNAEHANQALAELKDGIEIKGKKVSLSASMDNNTLYLGNICKTWTKDQVHETLTKLGVEQVVELCLLDDTNGEEASKGYASIKFNTHNDAMSAFRRLREPDAIFGSELSATVAFEPPQAKTVFIDHIPSSWDKENLEELCKKYGEIARVWIPKRGKRHFGFVDFVSRECSLACIEGINNANIQDGDTKVCAYLSRSKNKYKKRGAQRPVLPGNIDEMSEAVEKDMPSKTSSTKDSIEVNGKGKAVHKSDSLKGNKHSNFRGKNFGDKSGKALKSKKRKNKDQGYGRPKRARSNHNLGRPLYATSYLRHNYSGTSRSAEHSSDLEPHAGYLPSRKQGKNPYEPVGSRYAAYRSPPVGAVSYGAGMNRQSSYHPHPSYGGYGGTSQRHPYSIQDPYSHRRNYY